MQRSEEHTSELQSLRHLVCLLLSAFPTRRSSDLTRWLERPLDGATAFDGELIPGRRLDEEGHAAMVAGRRRRTVNKSSRRLDVPVHDRDGCRLRERPCKDRKSTRLNSSHLGISYAFFSRRSLHDALPILPGGWSVPWMGRPPSTVS